MFKKKEFFLKLFDDYKKTGQIPLVDLHIHTNWTDGENSISDMCSVAIKKKINSLLFSEHSRKSSGDWFYKFAEEIKNERVKIKDKCLLLTGTEVKVINEKGDLDLSSKIKDLCDLVMASVHRFPGEKGIKNKDNIFSESLAKKFSKQDACNIEFNLAMNAIENSDFDILGHPLAMSIKRFNFDPPWDYFLKIIKKAKKNDKVFEINYHYHKNYKKLLDACVENGTLISFGSNAHNTNELGKITEIPI